MITIEGEKELYAKIEQITKITLDSSRKGLRAAGMNIIADAKENLRTNGSISSRKLSASGKVQAVEGDKDSLDVGFFAQGSNNAYAYYVEYGRRSGGMPYPPDLVEWVRKKNLKNKALTSAVNIFNAKRRTRQSKYTKGDLLLSAAWALAKHIAKNGTKPHPFFGPAVEKNRGMIEDIISSEVKEEIK